MAWGQAQQQQAPNPITRFQFPAVAETNAQKNTSPLTPSGQSAFGTVGESQAVNQQTNAAPAYTPQAPPPSAAPGGALTTTADAPGMNLVEYGGYQIDQSVLGYAQYITNNFGMTLSSGYRDPEHNASVNGVPNSYHLSGRALDFSGSSAQMQSAAAWARQNGATEVLIHNAGSGMHLHVAW